MGTMELLKLCSIGTSKSLLYISTLAYSNQYTVNYNSIKNLRSGYTKSKLVAEVLVNRASQSGLNCCSIRCGMVGWSTETGAINTEDIWGRLLLGCLKMNCWYKDSYGMDGIPVNLLSDKICFVAKSLSVTKMPTKEIVMTGEQPLIQPHTIYQAALSCGFKLQLMEYEDWYNRVLMLPSDNPLYSITPHLPPNNPPLRFDEIGSKYYCNDQNKAEKIIRLLMRNEM
eukprot:NODE_2824_length_1483_cov_41.069853_g2442_i0.p1 GENE.NODE_2824_length_1483_cov_41.069853_g2442_i0~~NODE_2824_length_1483_cov_41.069853_g2442_i0.p1  ORF type:complete len:227 (-),score=34.19 NODE_2824_length_1483_cov_41.069853_g2442_i0:76-756(-)